MIEKRGWIICICVVLLAFGNAQMDVGLAETSKNLVPNSSFEELDAADGPVDWYASSYRTQAGYSRMQISDAKAHTGSRSAMVENANPNDARFVCTIPVEPESMYRLSGYILVESMEDQGNGANLALENIYAYTSGLYDTQGQWTYVECYGETGPRQHEISIGVRVGGYSAESAGKAYFDDITLEKVTQLPDSVLASLWYAVESPKAAPEVIDTQASQKSTVLFIFLALVFLLAALLCRPLLIDRALDSPEAQAKRNGRLLWIFGLCMLAALVLRIALASQIEGYQVDINCFKGWSLRMVAEGPTKFYSPDTFCDYPPGSMLLLWPVGLLLNAVGLSNNEAALLVVKLIPILSDMAGAMVLFAFAKRHISLQASVCLALLYAFNPAALVNGAAWGQIDSLLALLMMLVTIQAMRHQWKFALPIFILAVLMKPQALMLAPVGLIWLLVSLIRGKETRRQQLKQILWGVLLSLLCGLLIVIPFAISQKQPLTWLVGLYGETLSSYGYATLNTANLYYLFGANWGKIENLVPAGLYGSIASLLLGLSIWRLIISLRQRPSKTSQTPPPSANSQKNLALAALCGASGVLLLIAGLVGISYGTFGTVMMVFVFLWVMVCCFANPDPAKLPFWMALALIGVYVLGVKMHERYLFIALPLLLMAYATTRDKRMLVLCVGFSITTFINTAIILDNSILFGSAQGHLNMDTFGVNVALCILNLLLCGYAGYVSLSGMRQSVSVAQRSAGPNDPQKADHLASYRQGLLNPLDAKLHLTLKDYLIMLIASVLYACLTFYNLGSTVAPQNGWVSTSPQEQIVFQVDTSQDFTLVYYAGVSYKPFSVAVSQDGASWSKEYLCDMREGLCYRWQYALQYDESTSKFLDNNPSNVLWLSGKYLRLTAQEAGLNLLEVVARDREGQTLPMRIISHLNANEGVLVAPQPPQNLLDEQDTLQGEPGWFNGTYFDEIYHGRTAYEHLHGLPPYETTHPPLGKLLMSAAIAVFGMTPFGWRFAGAFIGVLMLPALYLLAKQLTRRRDLATFAMLLLTFDLMHFAQTRIATIDSFPVFFIMLSYLCMARYMMFDVFALAEGEPPRLFTRAFWRGLIPLGLAGLFMGLSIASKWIGLYSAIGLAVLFFAAVYRQFRMGNLAFDYPINEDDETLTLQQKNRVRNARDHALTRVFITCGFCLVFFLVVPALIYYLSYIPYLQPTGAVTLKRIFQAQQGMLNYHSTPGLGMDHPFQSPWWQWPFLLKPMWFAQDKFEPEGFSSTIMCMGNPLIFYVGALAMVAIFALFVRKYVSFHRKIQLRGTDGNLALPVMVMGFLAQYLPWVMVPRSMYIYHYFASVPFIILATTWLASYLPMNKKVLRNCVMWGFVAMAAAFFVMFYPYVSGILTPNAWFEAMKWLPTNLYY